MKFKGGIAGGFKSPKCWSLSRLAELFATTSDFFGLKDKFLQDQFRCSLDPLSELAYLQRPAR